MIQYLAGVVDGYDTVVLLAVFAQQPEHNGTILYVQLLMDQVEELRHLDASLVAYTPVAIGRPTRYVFDEAREHFLDFTDFTGLRVASLLKGEQKAKNQHAVANIVIADVIA